MTTQSSQPEDQHGILTIRESSTSPNLPTKALEMEHVPVQPITPSTPYTTFTRSQKRQLTLIIGLATITSPLTATIYFPLLPLLREHFHTSSEAINITITIYIVFQALSPAIFGPLSDTLGRRPVYLLTLSIYCAGNIGLALNKSSYAALLALRALQSLGASAAYSVSFGVVADVCVPSERGRMLGPVSMALNLGACVGPVVGGWVGYKSGKYEWIFWTLLIIGGLLLSGVALLLPETARSVVGNGSRRGKSPWDESWLKLCRSGLKGKREPVRKELKLQGETEISNRPTIRQRFKITNPLACLRIIFYFDTALALWMHGSFYVVDYCLVGTTPDIFGDIYNFNEFQIGLAYLPRGLGIIIGGYCNGKMMDHNYRVTARHIGWKINKTSGDDLTLFPIERARSRGSLILLIISTATLIGYGWAVSRHVHVAVPLILQWTQGFWGTCFYTIYSTLLVDIFPESPSTAAAAASIVRCAMAASGVAILQPLLSAAGREWYFTALGLWSGGFGALAVIILRRKGMQWRTRRTRAS
jgi:multidrug resistance protein